MAGYVGHTELAWKALSLGYSVVPAGGGRNHKAPLVSWKHYQYEAPSEEQFLDWVETKSPTVWALVVKKGSGPLGWGIDIEPTENVAMFSEMGIEPHVQTKRGAHLHFASEGQTVATATRTLGGVQFEVKGPGSCLNFCGENAHAYYEVLEEALLPDNLGRLEQLPQKWRSAILSPKPTKSQIISPRAVCAGQRNLWLCSKAGVMVRAGFDSSAVETALLRENEAKCSPPLSEGEVKQIAKSVLGYAGGTVSDVIVLPREVLGAVGKMRLAPTSRSLFDSITLHTIGYGKTKDRIAYSQFAQECGVDARNVSRGIGELRNHDMINVEERGQERWYSIRPVGDWTSPE